MKKHLILGLGNPVMSDDGAGLLALQKSKQKYSKTYPTSEFKENFSGGIDMLDQIIDSSKMIIVDSINTKQVNIGEVAEFNLDSLMTICHERLVNAHGLNLPTIINAGKKCGYNMPKEIIVLGIEAKNLNTISEEITPEVLLGIDIAVERIGEILLKWNC